MTHSILKNIYSIDVPLPNNPLKTLNCYLIKAEDGGRNLLIDTGFNMPVCLEALLSGMKELGITPKDTDIFITHIHSDHTGNAYNMQELGARILMTAIDYDVFRESDWGTRSKWYVDEGISPEEMELISKNSPANTLSSPYFEAIELNDGDTLRYGGYELRCVLTPGHSRGHMCLYEAKEKLMFCGDHVLFDITPNICSCGEGTNMLGDYLKSLEKIRGYDIALALPAHRSLGETDIYSRIDALSAHHKERLREALELVRGNEGSTAYEIAGLMQWNIKTKSWADFPVSQKWFAIGEALAHLDYLRAEGRIRRESDENGTHRYYFEG